MHSANADRRLHVASCADALHADGVAVLSVSRPTSTVYATVTLAWAANENGRAAKPWVLPAALTSGDLVIADVVGAVVAVSLMPTVPPSSVSL